MSKRTGHVKSTLLVCLAIAFALVLPPGIAVHDEGLFELGNGVNPTVAGSGDIVGSGQAGPDWADIFNANGNVTNLFGGITATFLKDNTSQASAVDDTVFSSGSAKNNDLPTSWTWDAGNVPAKDDLSNSYAYAIINPNNGHLIVYVGMERLDPSGDSHLDIEFFQDDVGLDEAAPCNDPGADATPCHFVGNRTHHDVLVSMDYTKGGGLGSLVVHVWNDTTDVYDEVETVTGEGCNGVAAANLTADSICGFNNGGSINGGPWDNFDRHGNIITLIPGNGFTEFGLDLTAAAGNETPCVSTILAKSRSSQSFTAELKDFSGPFPFDVCGAEIDIEPDGVNLVGQPHNFTVFVNATIAGVAGPAPDGTIVHFWLNGTGGASAVLLGETCSSGTVGGTCNISFTSNTPGTILGHALANVDVGGTIIRVETNGVSPNSDDAVKIFVGRPIIKLGDFGYNNTATDATPKAGIVNGTTNYTIHFHNYGNVTGNLTVFLNSSIVGGALASGTFTYNGSTGGAVSQPSIGASCVTLCTVKWSPVSLAPGGDVTFTVSVNYNSVPDGTVIRAALKALYESGGIVREASGSPATIDFTAQSD